jgi:enhancer of polycomb-like protein
MQRPSAPQLRLPQKPGIQGAEDLQSLEDVQAEKENEILHEIKHNIAKHVDWNEGYVDFTKAPLSPSPEPAHQLAFRPAITTQLPTPPSSDSSEHMLDSALDTTNAISSRDKLAYPMEKNGHTGRIPSFRRRVGRGGRLMIDRRDLAARKADSYAPPADTDPWKADRYKFDNEDSDEESPFDRSKYDTHIMLHRALMVAKARDHAVAAQAHAQAQAAQAQQRRLQADQGTANNGPPTNPGPGASTAATET